MLIWTEIHVFQIKESFSCKEIKLLWLFGHSVLWFPYYLSEISSWTLRHIGCVDPQKNSWSPAHSPWTNSLEVHISQRLSPFISKSFLAKTTLLGDLKKKQPTSKQTNKNPQTKRKKNPTKKTPIRTVCFIQHCFINSTDKMLFCQGNLQKVKKFRFPTVSDIIKIVLLIFVPSQSAFNASIKHFCIYSSPLPVSVFTFAFLTFPA